MTVAESKIKKNIFCFANGECSEDEDCFHYSIRGSNQSFFFDSHDKKDILFHNMYISINILERGQWPA
jgi:hypothetical protein